MTSRTKPLPRRGDEMDLPPAKTCADCAHFRRCNSMFGHIAADESCDWSPSRFYPILKEEPHAD